MRRIILAFQVVCFIFEHAVLVPPPHRVSPSLGLSWGSVVSEWCGTAELGRPGLLLGRTRSCGWRSIDVKAALLSPGWAALYSPLLYRHSTLYTALLPAATASACHLNWLHNITGCTSVLQYFTTLHLTLWNWQTKEVNLETMVKSCFVVSCDLL